ncbi:MAG: 2,3-bisphosphoglycerate-independent phosphoglycerate mutase [Deltaproteobacteria bacterium]|nr:2,3-bisphosphoglycerate-independent phosphoglycerate mutase [Deltaproteobacteria bacterium]
MTERTINTDWTLRPHPRLAARPGPLVLVIMDGVGLGRDDEGNAVRLARTPTLDDLVARRPWVEIRAHGTAVGMPSDADMGNSEVGHNALGCGRVFDQGAKLVSGAIDEGRLFAGETWKWLAGHCAKAGRPLHFIGLLSDGNVHSHIEHLFALLRRAAQDGVRELYVHPLLDGRDVPETSALTYIDALEAVLRELEAGDSRRRCRIASGGGRMKVTMDRYEADWRIVERGWKAHVRGEGRAFGSAREAIETYRRERPGTIDQDLPEFVIHDGGRPVAAIGDGHGVVFFNFRGDRALEITRAFEQDAFDKFARGPRPDVLFAGMMQYDGDTLTPRRFLVTPPAIDRTMGELLARGGVGQLAIAETQKFGHVTYFWNGNRTGMFDERHERYVEVTSDRVPFEQRPWMKAAEVTDRLLEELASGAWRFLRVNFANGDMVGHTGVHVAAVMAVETVDLCLARIRAAVRAAHGTLLVTADHGNADEMFEWDAKQKAFQRDEAGRTRAKTAHTLNPVVFCIDDEGAEEPADPVAALPFGVSGRTVTVRRGRDWELDPAVAQPGLSNVANTCLLLLGHEPLALYDPPLIRPAAPR